MKKLLIASALMIGLISFSNAQQVAAPQPTKKAVTTKPAVAAAPTPAEKKVIVAKPIAAKPAVKATPASPATPAQGVVLKKDGTPDKRYKAAEAKGPLKKDGTPDLRYKTNKKS